MRFDREICGAEVTYLAARKRARHCGMTNPVAGVTMRNGSAPPHGLPCIPAYSEHVIAPRSVRPKHAAVPYQSLRPRLVQSFDQHANAVRWNAAYRPTRYVGYSAP